VLFAVCLSGSEIFFTSFLSRNNPLPNYFSPPKKLNPSKLNYGLLGWDIITEFGTVGKTANHINFSLFFSSWFFDN
jgi:hypothetical protein